MQKQQNTARKDKYTSELTCFCHISSTITESPEDSFLPCRNIPLSNLKETFKFYANLLILFK